MSAVEPLIKDAFAGEPPTKRTPACIQSQREKGAPVLDTYCVYAPMELFHIIEEAGGIVAGLDSCTGIKCFMNDAAENTGDPVRSLTDKNPCVMHITHGPVLPSGHVT